MVLLISYDLNGQERPSSYTAAKEAIEQRAMDFRRPLYSQWFVQTNESPRQWFERLDHVLDADDKIFICQVREPNLGAADEGGLGLAGHSYLRL